MDNIAENIERVNALLLDNVSLVAVSKTKPMLYIEQAYQAGQRLFGENKALEMREKYYALPKDIEWHFIGHLQTNKIKYIAPFVALIHSIDSLDLLEEVNKYAKKNNRIIPCLLQIYIAKEETKYGLLPIEAEEIFKSKSYLQLENIKICGLMGMATNTENSEQIRTEFAMLKSYFDRIKIEYFKDEKSFKEISMGMTDDYGIAIEEGSTMVRVGSGIFGSRIYL